MGILELILLILIIAGLFGRGSLGMGVVLDVVLGILVLILVFRLFGIFF